MKWQKLFSAKNSTTNTKQKIPGGYPSQNSKDPQKDWEDMITYCLTCFRYGYGY